MGFVIEELTRRHERDAFDCGEAPLNDFIRRYASQNARRGIGRTYVAVPEGELRVVGYHTLAASSVEFSAVPPNLTKNHPKYPIPVVLLGRLATCRSVRGQGLGELLLVDALTRALEGSAILGIAAVHVVAKSETARSFYTKYGFIEMLDDPLHLYLPIKTADQLVQEVLGEVQAQLDHRGEVRPHP